MLSKIWIINLVLAGLIAVSWIGIWSVRHSGGPSMPDIRNASTPDTAMEKPRTAEKKPPEPSTYDAMVEKNLFSPDRVANITPQETQVVSEALKISGEKVMLFGVVMTDDYKSALINNPGKDPGGKAYLWVKEGEKINNLEVADIQAKHIILSDGELQYKILLYDSKNNKKHEAAKQPAAVPEEITKSQEGGPSHIKVDSETTAKKQPVEQPKAIPETAKPKGNEKSSEETDYEVFETPFGKIKKKTNK